MATTYSKRTNAVRDGFKANAIFGDSGEVTDAGLLVKLPNGYMESVIQNTGESDLYFAFGGNVDEIEGGAPTVKLAAGTTISLRVSNPVLYLKTGAGETTTFTVYAVYFSSTEIYDYTEEE